MNLGVFAKTYERRTVDEIFAACAGDGLPTVQFNFVSVGLSPMPDVIDPEIVHRVRRAADETGVAILSLSATFNMIHPDQTVRDTGLRRLEVLASVAGDLGATILSLCTGSRDPDNMWRFHPGNDQPDAWTDILASMRSAVVIADRYNLMLGIEPEPGNVIRDARRAERLLAEIGSDRIGVVLDPANLIEGRPPERVDAAIDEGVSLLGSRTIVGHGKDRDASSAVQAPGQGVVPWSRFLGGLQWAGFDGSVILHGFPETEVPAATQFLNQTLAELDGPKPGRTV